MTTAHPTRITNAHIKRFLLGVLLSYGGTVVK